MASLQNRVRVYVKARNAAQAIHVGACINWVVHTVDIELPQLPATLAELETQYPSNLYSYKTGPID